MPESIKTVSTVSEVKQWRELIAANSRVGFVPTMGSLHAGHRSLVERAVAENDKVIVSVFVNPTQFNNNSDYVSYPSQVEKDKALLEEWGASCVWLPAREELYADQYRYRVRENELALVLEGASRPGHFDGVLTVVLKLLLIVSPHSAYFGEKDYQQLLLVRGMVESLFLNTKVIACPVIRTKMGLALSSRHARLSDNDLQLANRLYPILCEAKSAEKATEMLKLQGFEVDYVVDQWQRRLAAVTVGGVRLIDNIPLSVG